MATTTDPNIDAVFAEFLDARRAELRPGALRDYEDTLELLRDSLNGYAYESLTEPERRRWQRAFDAGDESAFCELFGPEKIPEHLGEFFGYFMVRKVMVERSFLHSAGTAVADLVRWLGERGHIESALVEAALDRANDAARDLPRADRLGEFLYEAARKAPRIDVNALTDDDYVEDFLDITRVDPEALWFGDAIGPVPVPGKATEFAEVGWSVNIVLARTEAGWQILEVGNVYPS
jgi:hypothetical protein